ncbi:redoxin domain-containing protein [Phytohabitans sp. ZYX-F-186]|uniref:Redoxin domain-containing protein n=1 Tax=Phytohabitans maris TaxID=3071409 RepID=A0ABU0ZRL5_9ACTN|nr:redoxin family protein [Phytohabitans sp. ZYX-F-186]MDQ7909656.1 redoxin domain-containing protein [Phytohabitans sp. ZYX-F-186]
MRVRLVAAVLFAAAVVVGAGGCGGGATAGGDWNAGRPPAAGQPAAAGQEPAAERKAGPVPATLKFTGTTLDGKAFDAASLAGRPTVLWFWAPWCATCFGQAASVSDMQAEFGGKVNLLGVAGLGDAKEMAEFVADGQVGNVTHLNDQAGAVWKKFQIAEQSTYVFLDQDGKVLSKGWMDSIDFEGKVAELAG